jgi:hypothetical protein
MSGSKVIAAGAGFAALLACGGLSHAATEPCSLGSDSQVISVSPYTRPIETGGYGGTVNPELRGADIRVGARPGLTREWMQAKIDAQVAAGVCDFGTDKVSVEVLGESDVFVVRVTSTYEGPGVTRLPTTEPGQRAASEILRRARGLTAE